MAKANTKPPRGYFNPPIEISAILQKTAKDNAPPQQRPAFAWMQITDAFLERLGYLPGQHVLFSVDHRSRQIIIGLDHHDTIAGQPMTEQAIEEQDHRI